MIPRIIHWCWFGGKEVPVLERMCRESWERSNPSWKIVLWNEETFDVGSMKYTREAYKHGRFAFVTDYVRGWCLNKYGGVYVDADVEIRASLEVFRGDGAFTGFESQKVPFTALWGSEKGHRLAKAVVGYYEERSYRVDEKPNTGIVSEIIKREYGIGEDQGIVQKGTWEDSRLCVYPATQFCIDMGAGTAIHHFSGSWIGKKRNTYELPSKRARNRYMVDMLLKEKVDGYKALAQCMDVRDIAMILIVKCAQKTRTFIRLTQGIIETLTTKARAGAIR